MKFWGIFFAGLFLVSVAGCATQNVAASSEKDLKAKVASLEEQLRAKDEEIRNLQDNSGKGTGDVSFGTAEKLSYKQIQQALKNAGYYKGTIDGKMGGQTKKALKKFQHANGLKADGVAGKRTMIELQKHL
jgi:peptidoglycan hydrolase-like protein with peptidoglycan-binding domain